ncbi:MAG: hypothetical protein LBL81_05070 [Tannerella sp.]|jgi:hypothetical protein|nr:hypothetical protein [Tannerella sp.]
MKRTFQVLLLALLILCGGKAYRLLNPDATLQSETSGRLSEIAGEVTAIALPPEAGSPRVVKLVGDHLFFLSDEGILYRLDYRTSRRPERLTRPEEMRVAAYLVDAPHQRLIAMGNTNDVFYYSFSGELLHKEKLPQGRIHSAVLCGKHIWTAEEHTAFDADTQAFSTKQDVEEYDPAFRPIRSHPLLTASWLSYQGELRLSPAFQLGVTCYEQTPFGKIPYAYLPPSHSGQLLLDSLMLHGRIQRGLFADDEGIPVSPLRLGKRYWMASAPSYFFCFDSRSGRSWNLAEGFDDDFYHTGHIHTLRPANAEGSSCYFCKGQELYLVRLKA